ncbi:hypothetical protein [Sandarakinorhabdus sp. DWP1-3-1]|uniref:hypothetical protein n=1 Tax=Sandarakinorhabdus sp. DWP1-3-1 TaxID=2804627 RepID=UPI003CF1EE18
MTSLAVGDIWQSTIAVIRPRLGELVAVAAPFTLLVDMVLTLYGPTPPQTMAGYTIDIVLVLLLLPALIGMIAQLAVTRLVAVPEEPPRLALSAAFATAPLYLGALLLTAAPTALGMLLLIVPGLYLVARLYVVAPIIAVDRLGPVAAVQRSWTMTAGHGGPILLFLVLLLLFLFGASMLAAGVGSAFASVLAVVGLKAVGTFVAALIGASVAMLMAIASAVAATVVYLKLR